MIRTILMIYGISLACRMDKSKGYDLDRPIFRLEVKETAKGRYYWRTNKKISEQVRLQVSAADVLVAPWEQRAETGPSFPDGTTYFYRFLQESLEGRSLLILADRESYTELALHGESLRLPSIIVSKFMLPVLVLVVAHFAIENLDGTEAGALVEFELVVENEDGRCISIRYEGPPDRIADSLISEAERCFPSTSPTSTAKPTPDENEPKPKPK